MAEPLSRVLIEDNIWENGGYDNPYGGAGGTAPRAVQLLSDIKDLTFHHNEVYGQYGNQVVRNNIIAEAPYGFQNASNLFVLAPGAIVQGNILAPAYGNNYLPEGNCITWPPSTATACSAAGKR